MNENKNDRDVPEDEVDYTTPGDPIRSAQHFAEEGERDATPGDPLLDDEDEVEDEVDYTTPGNPIDSPQHEAEEHWSHATPGEPLEGPDED